MWFNIRFFVITEKSNHVLLPRNFLLWVVQIYSYSYMCASHQALDLSVQWLIMFNSLLYNDLYQIFWMCALRKKAKKEFNEWDSTLSYMVHVNDIVTKDCYEWLHSFYFSKYVEYKTKWSIYLLIFNVK